VRRVPLGVPAGDPRTLKQQLVRAGHAHAALVFDARGLAQGWCQYGSPDELELRHGREYRKEGGRSASTRGS
jgi:hypothetical protein